MDIVKRVLTFLLELPLPLLPKTVYITIANR
jgi:hypothetical protein